MEIDDNLDLYVKFKGRYIKTEHKAKDWDQMTIWAECVAMANDSMLTISVYRSRYKLSDFNSIIESKIGVFETLPELHEKLTELTKQKG